MWIRNITCVRKEVTLPVNAIVKRVDICRFSSTLKNLKPPYKLKAETCCQSPSMQTNGAEQRNLPTTHQTGYTGIA